MIFLRILSRVCFFKARRTDLLNPRGYSRRQPRKTAKREPRLFAHDILRIKIHHEFSTFLKNLPEWAKKYRSRSLLRRASSRRARNAAENAGRRRDRRCVLRRRG